MKPYLAAFLFFASLLWADMGAAGGARYRGLFLWSQEYASASGFVYEIADTVKSGTLDAWARYRNIRADMMWLNYWKVVGEAKVNERAAGVRARFRNLALSSEVASDNGRLRVRLESVANVRDSLVYLGANLRSGTLGGFRFRWTSEQLNGVLDTVEFNYEADYAMRGLVLGSRYDRHELELSANYLNTRRASYEDVLYAVRDSSTFWDASFEYAYTCGSRTFRAYGLYADLDAKFYMLRSEDGDTKRFGYVPIDVNVELAGLSLESKRYRIDAGAAFLQGNVKRNGKRFFESLSPNRAIEFSILKTLSFEFFKRDYRLYGDFGGFLAHVRAERHFDFTPANWLIRPTVSADFVYAQGKMDFELDAETRVLLHREIDPTYYHGDIKVGGAIVQLRILQESPHKTFYLDLGGSQVVPFFLLKNLTRVFSDGTIGDISASGGSGVSSDEAASIHKKEPQKKESLPIFKTGFVLDISAGMRF